MSVDTANISNLFLKLQQAPFIPFETVSEGVFQVQSHLTHSNHLPKPGEESKVEK